MPNGQPEPAELKKIKAEEELNRHRIQLHNLKFQVQIVEAIVKKLEELSR